MTTVGVFAVMARPAASAGRNTFALSTVPSDIRIGTSQSTVMLGYFVGPSCEAIHSGLIIPATPVPGFHGSASACAEKDGTVMPAATSAMAVSRAARAVRRRCRVALMARISSNFSASHQANPNCGFDHNAR